MPVDLYVGGKEHATLHLLYARFWHKVLHCLGVVSDKEPFPRLVHQGMILGPDGEKMSKSKGNVINPDTVVKEVGADALRFFRIIDTIFFAVKPFLLFLCRLYEMFMGPLEAVKPWQMEQVSGVVRFRDRIYSLIRDCTVELDLKKHAERKVKKGRVSEKILEREMHKTIKKVTNDIETLSFNTAISTLMVYTNLLSANYVHGTTPVKLLQNLILMVSPMAPHLGEECWELLGHTESLAYCAWPVYDDALCADTVFNVPIQVNGKLRATIEVGGDIEEEEILSLAKEKVEKFLSGQDITKIIYIKNKIVNIVLAG